MAIMDTKISISKWFQMTLKEHLSSKSQNIINYELFCCIVYHLCKLNDDWTVCVLYYDHMVSFVSDLCKLNDNKITSEWNELKVCIWYIM